MKTSCLMNVMATLSCQQLYCSFVSYGDEFPFSLKPRIIPCDCRHGDAQCWREGERKSMDSRPPNGGAEGHWFWCWCLAALVEGGVNYGVGVGAENLLTGISSGSSPVLAGP